MRGDYASLAPFIKAVAGYEQPPPIRDRDLEHLIARYDGEIAYVDSQIGRLLSGLEERALANDTMVVLYRGETTTEPDEAGKLMMALNVEAAAKHAARAEAIVRMYLQTAQGARADTAAFPQ